LVVSHLGWGTIAITGDEPGFVVAAPRGAYPK
jgi:hypothetical protein